MIRQTSFFDNQEMAPKAQAASPSRLMAAGPVAVRGPDWRAPTEGELACVVCDGASCYAQGPTAWCRACVPQGFLPGGGQ